MTYEERKILEQISKSLQDISTTLKILNSMLKSHVIKSTDTDEHYPDEFSTQFIYLSDTDIYKNK